MSSPKHRKYKIGACYGCQKCLFCFKDLKNKNCSCDLKIKPSHNDTFRTKYGQEAHNRCYKISTTRLAQVAWLKERSKFFEYNSNFDKNFNLTLCSTCNSRYNRVKNVISLSKDEKINQDNIINQDATDQDTIDQDTIDQDTIDQDTVDQDIINQYIIDQNSEIEATQSTFDNSSAGKWLTFKEEEINNFYSFKSSLNSHIRKCLDLRFIYDDDYEITYKVNGREQAMSINDREDFLSFVDECKKPDNLAKTMYVYIILKNPKQFHKRKSELDKIYDGKGIYTTLEKSFEEQGITVNGIKELTDNQLIELGVTKIGWRINIKQEARKY
ncbi:16991_t:CDS:2 [Cetraspora pellucida]|uniref:16991_t:CDS:1 n=1 Tax=Cetraspora pellucida TaxID=1433469 RepID=A0ACA9KYA0_9GLOM|nr:16991_t:CDS:2 [Cetraspora pellucida]